MKKKGKNLMISKVHDLIYIYMKIKTLLKIIWINDGNNLLS